jgi:hypothetical protein
MNMAKRTYRESSEETRNLQSIRKQGCNNPNFGKQRDEETKQKIAQKMKEYWSKIPSRANETYPA